MKRLFLILATAGLMAAEAPAARLNLLEVLGTGARSSSRARQASAAKSRKPVHVEHATNTTSAVSNVAASASAPATKVVAPKPKATAPSTPAAATLSAIANETLTTTNIVTKVETLTNTITQVETLTNTVTQTLTNTVTQIKTLTNTVTQVDTLTNTITQIETLTNNVTQVETLTNTITQVEFVTNTITHVVTNTVLRGVVPVRESGPARISSTKAYYDRKEGYAVFTGNVHVDSEEYQMHAKKAYVFFEGTNELRRIVATGNVAITNFTKRAYGTKASYHRQNGMIVLYGDDKTAAEVRDESKAEDQVVRGSKIRFWTMSEQIEVLDAFISSPVDGGMKSLRNDIMPKK